MGCDENSKLKIENSNLFQSTHPSWGATYLQKVTKEDEDDFNPRTHRGVRPKRGITFVKVNDFNPRTHRGVRLQK